MRPWATCGLCAPSPWSRGKRSESWGRGAQDQHVSHAPARLRPKCLAWPLPRRYRAELESCRCKAEELGRGIALFQGLSNIAFNCEWGLPGEGTWVCGLGRSKERSGLRSPCHALETSTRCLACQVLRLLALAGREGGGCVLQERPEGSREGACPACPQRRSRLRPLHPDPIS